MSSADIYHINFNGTTYSFSITNVIAALCFVLACLTDALDGYLARRNQWTSDFGRLWDPIADKLLINAILICFAFQGKIYVWIPIIMISRDVIVDALRMYTITQKHAKDISANIFGKMKTIFQMLAIMIILFIFNGNAQSLNYHLFQNMLMDLALCASIISGIIYVHKFLPTKNKLQN